MHPARECVGMSSGHMLSAFLKLPITSSQPLPILWAYGKAAQSCPEQAMKQRLDDEYWHVALASPQTAVMQRC